MPAGTTNAVQRALLLLGVAVAVGLAGCAAQPPIAPAPPAAEPTAAAPRALAPAPQATAAPEPTLALPGVGVSPKLPFLP